MRRIFKKMIPMVALLILCTIALACMSGCTGEYADNLNKIFETEYFRCISYDNQHVTILALTELGQKQTDYLIIPKEINGMEVTTLGGKIKGSGGYGIVDRKRYRFCSSAKKIFFEGRNYILEDCQFDEDTIILSQFYESKFIKKLSIAGHTICSYKNEQFDRFLLADIVYYLNYKEADDVYCIDSTNTEGWDCPPEPFRESYIFAGWYLEKECRNEFFKDVFVSKKDLKCLHAKWILR